MRLFGSERIAGIMDRLGYKEGEVIQHSMITKSIERAQRKVEENNYGIRKRLLEYDDVMNSQREVIYKKRRHALYGERLALDIMNMQYDVAETVVKQNHETGDYENFKLELIRLFSIETPVDDKAFLQGDVEELSHKVFESAHNFYRDKSHITRERAYPIVKDVYENQGAQFQNIVVPFSDGFKTIQVLVPLKKAYETNGAEMISSMERFITLAMIDEAWKEHLREMDDLKQSVQNAVYLTERSACDL